MGSSGSVLAIAMPPCQSGRFLKYSPIETLSGLALPIGQIQKNGNIQKYQPDQTSPEPQLHDTFLPVFSVQMCCLNRHLRLLRTCDAGTHLSRSSSQHHSPAD